MLCTQDGQQGLLQISSCQSTSHVHTAVNVPSEERQRRSPYIDFFIYIPRVTHGSRMGSHATKPAAERSNALQQQACHVHLPVLDRLLWLVEK